MRVRAKWQTQLRKEEWDVDEDGDEVGVSNGGGGEDEDADGLGTTTLDGNLALQVNPHPLGSTTLNIPIWLNA